MKRIYHICNALFHKCFVFTLSSPFFIGRDFAWWNERFQFNSCTIMMDIFLLSVSLVYIITSSFVIVLYQFSYQTKYFSRDILYFIGQLMYTFKMKHFRIVVEIVCFNTLLTGVVVSANEVLYTTHENGKLYKIYKK